MSKRSGKKGTINFKKVAISVVVVLIIGIFQYFGIDIPIDTIYNDYQSGTTLNTNQEESNAKNGKLEETISHSLENIPEYQGKPYVVINNNIPFFTEEDYTTQSFEEYSELDMLGRCGVAYANICKEIMPKANEEREEISSIKPSGWKQKPYKGLVDGDYLYNRCHLIGWQLAGENANELNLITGTRYMNVEGMLPFEDMVDDYFEKKENENNHVLYRVTPIFEGSNLVASGVQMEAYSVEDNGEGVCFNIYVYNVQPGISINYATGENSLEGQNN